MEYREDCVVAYPHGWINVVVVPLSNGEVHIRVEWQKEFDGESTTYHEWTVEPTMAALKEHAQFGLPSINPGAETPIVFAAILRCVSKARAEIERTYQWIRLRSKR